jgi:hypothetical protein
MTDCNICCEKYTKNREKIECTYCSFIACSTCCETYLLSENIPHCMNRECKKEWTRNFMNTNFTKKFMTKTFKYHQEKVFLDRERSLLPATQEVVERIIRNEKVSLEVQKINEQIDILKKKKQEILDLHLLNEEINNLSDKKERKQFIRKCGSENCRGFLSTQWKCGICDKFTCNKCHVYKEKEEDHVCKTEDVETAKLMNADCKPCPKCATMIFKIDGCDQMWCTQCHTAFSWKTSAIETVIHNPHYYEYLRKTRGSVPRNPADNRQCEQALTSRTIGMESIFNPRKNPELTSLHRSASVIVGTTLHIIYVEIPYFHVNNVINNEPLRVSYLRNTITEEEFGIKLQRQHKSYHKKREIHGILTMYTQTVTDILFRFMDFHRTNIKSSTEIVLIRGLTAILNEVTSLIEYVNNCLNDISINYQCVTYKITIPPNNSMEFHTVLQSINKKGSGK